MLSRQMFTRFLKRPSKKFATYTIKTKGGGCQRFFEQCLKKLSFWYAFSFPISSLTAYPEQRLHRKLFCLHNCLLSFSNSYFTLFSLFLLILIFLFLFLLFISASSSSSSWFTSLIQPASLTHDQNGSSYTDDLSTIL